VTTVLVKIIPVLGNFQAQSERIIRNGGLTWTVVSVM
jgi:hypothetical protein